MDTPQFTMKLTDVHKGRIDQLSSSAVALAPSTNQGADVSKWCGAVFDQQSEGSCTACSTRDYLLWLQNKYGYPLVYDPSVNAIYYFARQIFGDLTTDGGSTTNDAYQGVITYGVIPSVDDQYDKSTLFVQPPVNDVVFKALTKTNLVANTASIRSSLDSGIPTGISVVVEQSLFTPSYYDGMHIVDSSVSTMEGHAIFCVAYKPDSKYGYLYKCQGSWGTGYADNGYFWFTESYLTSCLMEVVQLDIPASAPTKPYALSASFGSDSVLPGVANPITITTTLAGEPLGNQNVSWQQVRTDTGHASGTWTTDVNGKYVAEPKLNIVGTDDVTLSWTPPDGVARTVTLNAAWSDNPQPNPIPNPTPTPPSPPQPPKPNVLPEIETDVIEHHKGFILNNCTCVPKELWSRVGTVTKVTDNTFTVNGKTYQGVDDNGDYYIEWTVMTDNGYTISHISNGWQFTK